MFRFVLLLALLAFTSQSYAEDKAPASKLPDCDAEHEGAWVGHQFCIDGHWKNLPPIYSWQESSMIYHPKTGCIYRMVETESGLAMKLFVDVNESGCK